MLKEAFRGIFFGISIAALAAHPEACLYAQKHKPNEIPKEREKSIKESNILRLDIEQEQNLLTIGVPVKIKITAHFKDGIPPQDITSIAKIKPSADLEIENGAITAKKAGFHTLSASHERVFKSAAFFAKNKASPASEKKPKKGKKTIYRPPSKIDAFINENLKTCEVEPSEICSDGEFLRRLYLDATGLLPDAKTAEDFLKSQDKNKREKAVEKILDSPEFLDMLSMRLSDVLRIKSEFPSNLWPNAAQAYYTWIRDSLESGIPYDILAKEMLLSSGSNFKNPPVNFYRAVNEKNAENFAEAAALVFMGVRTNCVKCHPHPEESWTEEDGRKFAAIFKHLSFKKSKEWKEEILTFEIPSRDPQEFYIFGEKITSEGGKDPREAFVKWLTDEKNPYFAKIAVNRIWHWIFGAGISRPADDLRPNKISSNPKLEKYLEDVFVNSGCNLKAVFKEIFLSDAYSRSSRTNSSNANEDTLFSRHIPTRLDAESLNDIISGIFGVYQPFKSITPEPYAFWPEDFRAIQLHDGSVSNPFLTLFGKPGRNSSHLNDRSNKLSMQQMLHLLGSSNINSKLDKSQFLKDLAKQPVPPNQKITTLYLTFLTRHPTSKELDAAKKYLEEKAKTTYEGLKDISWALINTKEFLFKL
ncbi:MAG: DUF1553 domain-containing protein [Opitutales bacterium]|nr:DUF1553 domain-containing protein [Opitutales bacterium]